MGGSEQAGILDEADDREGWREGPTDVR